MSSSLVSVIIPTYNRGALVDRAIRSALNQTYPYVEIIVVDDGSKDDTRERILAHGDRVRYVYQSNQGLAAARNIGMAQSRGAFIAFLDDDDIWLPHKVERQVETLKANLSAGLAYCWWTYVDQLGNQFPQRSTPEPQPDVLAALLDGWYVLPSGVMVTRSCAETVGTFDPQVNTAEDWDYWIRIASAGYQFACVREVLLLNCLHSQHLSGNHERNLASVLQVIAKLNSILPPSRWNEKVERKVRSRLLISNGCGRLSAGDWDGGIRLVAEGVRLCPSVIETPQFYLGLASYDLPPLGYRSSAGSVSTLTMAAANMLEMLEALLCPVELGVTGVNADRARGSCHLALAILYARKRCTLRSLSYLVLAVRNDPGTILGALSAKLQKLVRLRPITEPRALPQ